MRYLDWIIKYKQNALNDTDLLAFNHELTENAILREELNVWELTDEMLQVASAGFENSLMTDQQSSQTSTAFTRNIPYWLMAGIVIFIVIFYIFGFITTNDDKSEIIKEYPVQHIASLESPSEAILHSNETFKENLSSPPIESEVAKINTPKSRVKDHIDALPIIGIKIISVQSKEIALKIPLHKYLYSSEMVETNIEIKEGISLSMKSSNTILLKPGFHAKPGSLFEARIE